MNPWPALKPDKRTALAVQATRKPDEDALWGLLQHHLTTWGRAGAKTSPHTLRAYRSGLRAYLGFLTGLGLDADGLEEALCRPGPDLGVEYLRHLERAGRSPGTVNARRASASALYRALRWAGAATVDPLSDAPPVRDPTPKSEKRTPYSSAEVARLLEVSSVAERVGVLLGAQAGLRVSEIVSLTWDRVDLENRRLRVTGKGGKTAGVSIPKGLMEALGRLEARAGRVGPWANARVARGRLESLCGAAGVPYRGVHSLRHHAGTELYRKTKNLDVVARHLRHSSIETSRVYAKYGDDIAGNALTTWD